MYQQFIRVFPIVLCIGLMGYFARWRNILTGHATRSLLKVIFCFLLPCLAFYSLTEHLDVRIFKTAFFLPVFSIYAMIIGIFSGSLFLPFLASAGSEKAETEKARTFLHLSVVNNFQLLPLPFIVYMFGNQGLAIFFFFVFGMLFGLWTIGIWILKNDVDFPDQIRLLCSPLFITIVAALTIVFLGWRSLIPPVITGTAGMTGKAAVPLGVFITGAVLADGSGFKRSSDALLLVIVRSICYPAFILMSLTMLDDHVPIDNRIFNIVLICLIMPAPVISAGLCRKFNTGDAEFAETALFYTTLASVITVPAVFILFSR